MSSTWLGFALILLCAGMGLAQDSETAEPVLPVNPDSAMVAGTEREAVHPTVADSAALFRSASWHATADEFERTIATDIVDLAGVLPAATALDHGSVGQVTPFAFRGATPQQSAVMLNGVLLIDPLNGFTSSAVLPINLVERVSFHGPGSLHSFGRQPATGLLHVQTRRFESNKPYSKVQFRLGDFGYSDLGISFGLPIQQSTRFFFSGSRQELDNFFFDTPQGREFEPRDLENSRFLGSISHRPSRTFELQAVTLLNKNEIEVPAPQPPDIAPSLTNPRRKSTRFDQQLTARKRGLAAFSDELSLQLHFSRFRQESLDDSLLFDNKTFAWNAALQNDFTLGGQFMSLGGGFHALRLSSNILSDETDMQGYAFAQTRLAAGARAAITLQARAEKYSSHALQFLPSAKIMFDLNGAAVWLGAHRAVRYPSFAERFWTTDFYAGDVTLIPEKTIAAELGLNWQAHELSVQATAFVNRTTDWIADAVVPERDGFGARNLGLRTVSGLDLKASWDYLKNGQLGMVAAFLNVSESDPGKQTRLPEYNISSYAEIGRAFFDKFVFMRLSVIARLYGSRLGFAYPDGSIQPSLTSRSSDFVLDSKLTLIFASAVLTVSYENIFNRRYELVPGFSMPPRMLRFGVHWEFWD